MNKDDASLLRYILIAIEQIEHYTRGMSESEFLSRAMVQDAVVRQIEIISEAARGISTDFQGTYPKFPLAKISSIRKRIFPQPFNVNLTNVWNIVQDDLLMYKQALKKIL